MKKHIKIHGTNYCLCGLRIADEVPDIDATDCMQCGYIAGGLLGVRHNSKEFFKALRKLMKRSEKNINNDYE